MADGAPRFAELAIALGLLTKDQARAALKEQAARKASGTAPLIGVLLIELGYMDQAGVQKVLTEQSAQRREARRLTLKGGQGRFGDYQLTGTLGHGAMGAVYRAHDELMNRDVAIKVLNKSVDASELFIKRFQREIKLAGGLNHPNLVCAYGAGEVDGLPYLAMELVEGQTLKEQLKQIGCYPEARALALIKQVAAGLAYAHANELVHRDIKPANILLTRQGVAKVADMGLAKSVAEDEVLTRTGIALGTPYYMPPEQAKGDKQLDHRSDIYSLGATLYEMLTGKVPFNAENKMKVMLMHVNQPLRPPKERVPELSDGVDALVCRMMAKKPDDRYDCCEDVVEDIDKILSGEPMASPKKGRTRKPPAPEDKAKSHADRKAIPVGRIGSKPLKAGRTGKHTRVTRRKGEKGCLVLLGLIIPFSSMTLWLLHRLLG